jgi:hypothetical protein
MTRKWCGPDNTTLSAVVSARLLAGDRAGVDERPTQGAGEASIDARLLFRER